MTRRRSWLTVLGVLAALSLIAWLSPAPDRVTDRGVYEATAARGVVPDCTDLHCFRVLVAWTLGALPGPSGAKWTIYAVLANLGAAVAVFHLALAYGLTRRAARLAAALSAFGSGSLYTLHDPFTSDPLMYALGPLITLLLVRERVALAGVLGAIGVFAKEFAAAPLYIFAATALVERRVPLGVRALVAGNAALLAWLALQFTLMFRYNYGYGDNPSTHLLSGGYVRPWLEQQSLRGAASALFNVYGAAYLLAMVGLLLAPAHLRRFALIAAPVALLFAYVQQPDRALWNVHFLVLPLAALVLARAPAALAWPLVAATAAANLRVGAQWTFVPEARYGHAAAVALAVAAVAFALIRGRPAAAPVALSS